MPSLEILFAFYIGLSLLGMGGVVVWLRHALAAQKQAIDAHAAAMKSQSEALQGIEKLAKTMDAVLQAADVPKMLERLKAYQEFVDREKEAFVAEEKRRVDAEKRQLTENQKETLAAFAEASLALIDLAAELFPYVSKEQRLAAIDELRLPGITEGVRNGLRRLADRAPDAATGIASVGLGDIARARLSILGKPAPLRGMLDPKRD